MDSLFLVSYLSLVCEVALVPYEDEWDRVVALDPQDLLPELLRGLEGVVLSDGEDAEEALAGAEVVVPNRGVVLLTGSVQDVDLEKDKKTSNMKFSFKGKPRFLIRQGNFL